MSASDDTTPADLTGSIAPQSGCQIHSPSPGVYAVTVNGHANGDMAQQVNALLKQQQAAMKADIAAKRNILVAIDFSKAATVEDTFVAFMLKLSPNLRKLSGHLAAINIGKEARDPFRKTRVPHLIDVASLEEAVAQQRGEGGELGLAD